MILTKSVTLDDLNNPWTHTLTKIWTVSRVLLSSWASSWDKLSASVTARRATAKLVGLSLEVLETLSSFWSSCKWKDSWLSYKRINCIFNILDLLNSGLVYSTSITLSSTIIRSFLNGAVQLSKRSEGTLHTFTIKIQIEGKLTKSNLFCCSFCSKQCCKCSSVSRVLYYFTWQSAGLAHSLFVTPHTTQVTREQTQILTFNGVENR